MATNADIARHLGRKPAQISRWTRRGMPTVSLEAAARWVAANVRSRIPCKPATAATPAGAPADASEHGLRRRLLAAEVSIREGKARNEGGITLPSAKVEKGLITGLQLLRASTTNATGEVFESMTLAVGEDAARKVFDLIAVWWNGVHNVAADAILLGFQRELPGWGVDFRNRWVVRLRGNFPDKPYPGEPRAIGDVPPFPDGA